MSPVELVRFAATYKFAYELSEYPVLWKLHFKKEHKAPILSDFGSDWKQVFIVVRLTSQQKSTLALQQRLKDFQNKLSDTEEDNQKFNATLNRLQATLDFLSASGETSGITPLEETLFRNILRKKQNHSSGASCIITAKNPHGRPIYLQQIRRAEVPSNEASSITGRARSKSSEILNLHQLD